MLPIGGAFGQGAGALAGEAGTHRVFEHRPVKVARWPARIPYGCGISDELAQRAMACA
jgi:hypothetical protein